MEQNQNEQQGEHQFATSGARAIDPETGLPLEPDLEGESVVPDHDPSPEPTADDWRDAEEASGE